MAAAIEFIQVDVLFQINLFISILTIYNFLFTDNFLWWRCCSIIEINVTKAVQTKGRNRQLKRTASQNCHKKKYGNRSDG